MITTSSTPQLSNQRKVLEVHSHVSDAPVFYVGKFGVTIFKIVALYRQVSSTDSWEFIDIIIHGKWLDGTRRGEMAHRRYTRGKLELLHGWMIEFIENNYPGK